jgi:hypothetical protein
MDPGTGLDSVPLPEIELRFLCSPARSLVPILSKRDGRAIAQAVSLQPLTAAARVQAQVRSCGICGRQSGAGVGFLRALRLPLLILILPTAPHSSYIIRGWYNRPVSGRLTKWTQSHPTLRNKKETEGDIQTRSRRNT